MRHIYCGVGGRVRQLSYPYRVGGETGYTAQEDLKSIDIYNMGERRVIGSSFSVPEFQGPPWSNLLFHLGSPQLVVYFSLSLL